MSSCRTGSPTSFGGSSTTSRGTASPPAIAALTSLVPISQILFGSDNPYIPLSDTVEGVLGLGFSPAELRAIAYDNGRALAAAPWRALTLLRSEGRVAQG